MTVNDGVNPSLKGGWNRFAPPPLNPPLSNINSYGQAISADIIMLLLATGETLSGAQGTLSFRITRFENHCGNFILCTLLRRICVNLYASTRLVMQHFLRCVNHAHGAVGGAYGCNSLSAFKRILTSRSCCLVSLTV